MHSIIRALVQCNKCGWCCTIPRHVEDTEILAISALTNEKFEDAQEKLHAYPCGYLQNNQCTINEIKPIVCRWYPGPDAQCQAYQDLAEKIYQPGAMHRVCNEPELKELYTQLVITGKKEHALKLLEKLNISL